jgi:hypothetical protein
MSIKVCLANLMVVAVGSLTALAADNTVEAVYNQFIERFADKNPTWKTEITLSASVTNPPALPYRLHYNDSLGYYTYRPKRWQELNEQERFALQNDPRLPHFVREQAFLWRDKSNSRTTSLESNDLSEATESTTQSQQHGLLMRHGPNVWGYRFDPGELLNAQPLRLVELPP